MNDNQPFNYPPPVGQVTDDPASHGVVITFLQGLVYENVFAREGWVEMADENLNVYLYGDDPAPDDDVIVINDIQNAIIAQTDIQTKEPPSVTLEPVETGEPPESYWDGSPEQAAQLGIPAEQTGQWLDPTGQIAPPMALSEQQADFIRQFIAAGQLPEDVLVDVNDQLVSDFYQGVFDVYWMRSGTDLWIRQNLLETNIQGWAWGLYEFDDERQRHCLRHMSIKQVYVDPTVRDIADAEYAGLDLVIDAAAAKALYPKLAMQIDDQAREGIPPKYDGQVQFGQQFESKDFRRPMVVMRVFWLRNQPIALSEDEALQGGKLEARDVPQAPAEIPEGEGQGDGQEQVTPNVQDSAQMPPNPDVQQDNPQDNNQETEPSDGADQQQPSDDASAPAAGGPAAPVPTRRGLFLPDTDVEVTLDHPAWPTRLCLRQIIVIASTVVDDRECEHADIPLIHNVNLPIPGRPWGIGEPMRLLKLQEARSRMVDAIVTHTEYFKYPLVGMPESVWNHLQNEYGDARVQPGRTMVVPDALFQAMGGKIDFVYDPPPIGEGLVDAQALLKQELTEQSGHSDVLQGRAQPQVKSGKAIELLQDASTSMIGFKSQRTGDAVQRLARLMLHAIVRRLSTQQLGRVVSKYKPWIVDAIHQRGQNLEWDVKVIISSGNGQLIQAKKQQAMQEYQLALISRETCQEKLNIDVRQERNRMRMEAAQGMVAAAQQQQQQQQGQQGQQPAGGDTGAANNPAE